MGKNWKTLGRREAKKMFYSLCDVRRTATMEGANFDIRRPGVTKEIKDITKLWRRSWIIAPLDRIIERIAETYSFDLPPELERLGGKR